MIPIRRFSAFISRISLTAVLFLTSLFVIYSLSKPLFQANTQQFVPVENRLLNQHRHHHRKSQQAHRRVRMGKETRLDLIEICLIGIGRCYFQVD